MARISSSCDQEPIRLGKESDMAKKMVEEFELSYFLDAYNRALEEDLRVHSAGERPDFICTRSDGSLVGVELSKVVRDPQLRWAEEVFFLRDHMRPAEALLAVYERIYDKESKRQAPDWKLRDNTILVVQVMDCPLEQFWSELEPPPDPHAFTEIWLADYSELEAYGNIELFGLHPDRLWGCYESVRGKPYG